jgi:hypothetical protein
VGQVKERMILMKDLRNTTKLVKAILEENEMARNSDSYLYLKVLEHISRREDLGLEYMTVIYFLSNISKMPVPGFETVRRTRQKVQADCPDLASNKKVAEMRMENEKEFKSYALGVTE